MITRDRKHIIDYRLSPTEANCVAYKIACTYDKSLDPDICSEDFKRFISSYLTLNIPNGPFYLLPICKDARSDNNEPALPFIGSRLKSMSTEIPRQGKIIGILGMCRGYFKLPITVPLAQRHHAGVIFCNLDSMNLETLDSQGWWRKVLYPDVFANKSGKISLGNFIFRYNPSKNYHAYGKQENYLLWQDVVSCVYYALAYLDHILKTGSIVGCQKIKLDITDTYKNKLDFLKSYHIDISNPDIDSDADADMEDFVLVGDVPSPIENRKYLLPFELTDDNELSFSDEDEANKKQKSTATSSQTGTTNNFFVPKAKVEPIENNLQIETTLTR